MNHLNNKKSLLNKRENKLVCKDCKVKMIERTRDVGIASGKTFVVYYCPGCAAAQVVEE